MKKSRRNPFTLVEVVVVIVIMLVTGGIAISTMRTDSTARLIRNSTNEFRSLCSRARYKAMEMSEDRLVVYVPDEHMFYLARPVANEEEAMEYEFGFVIQRTMKWELPEEFELATDNSDPIEVFRFYPDGGASGTSFNLACKGHSVAIGVAKLSGSVVTYERGEGEQ